MTTLKVADINKLVAEERYEVFFGRLTVCVLLLHNGHLVTGESYCFDPAQFNEQYGKECSRSKAIQLLFEYEVYRLKDLEHKNRLMSLVKETIDKPKNRILSSFKELLGSKKKD